MAHTQQRPIARHLSNLATRRRWPALVQITVGLLAASLAVALRLSIPLQSAQLPTLTLIITIAVLTPFVGGWAGLTTAVWGGALSWYFLLKPDNGMLTDRAGVVLFGYSVLSLVILGASHLYGQSERRHHATRIAALEAEVRSSELFARELSHRQNNVLAVVQSIATQTLGDSPAAIVFTGRLRALADASRLLTSHIETPTAEANRVIALALKPFLDGPDRVAVTDCDTILPAQSVQNLALALHELCTNASKYGALSVPSGWIALECEASGDELEVRWKEHDGPPVRSEPKKGFGSNLLTRLSKSSELVFEADGLRCTLRMPRALIS